MVAAQALVEGLRVEDESMRRQLAAALEDRDRMMMLLASRGGGRAGEQQQQQGRVAVEEEAGLAVLQQKLSSMVAELQAACAAKEAAESLVGVGGREAGGCVCV